MVHFIFPGFLPKHFPDLSRYCSLKHPSENDFNRYLPRVEELLIVKPYVYKDCNSFAATYRIEKHRVVLQPLQSHACDATLRWGQGSVCLSVFVCLFVLVVPQQSLRVNTISTAHRNMFVLFTLDIVFSSVFIYNKQQTF